jgi:hypothetical protein
MRPTVLVGFAGALAAPEVVWSLVDRGYKVVAFARKGQRAALRHSRYVTCHEITPPEVDANRALSEVSSLCTELASRSPVVLFPLDDSAVWLGCRVPAQSGMVLAGPSATAATLALDKSAQIRAAQAAGLDVPRTEVFDSPADLRQVKHAFPIIIRPSGAVQEINGRLRKGGLWICENDQEVETAVRQCGSNVRVLVQPYIKGSGEGLFGLATREGVRAWSAHRRLRMMNPHGSGSSACISQTVSEPLRMAAERFIRDTQWRGLFMIELLRDSSGKAWFVEFNARPWGSMALCRRQGLEYPAWHVDLALDSDSPAGEGRFESPEPIICQHAGREFMHLLFVLKGPKSKALSEWPSFWKALFAILLRQKRTYLYNWRKDDAKVFAADFYSTVLSNVLKPRKPQTC